MKQNAGDTHSGWIDVSATLSDGMVHWPSDPEVCIYKVEKIGENEAVANLTAVSCAAHVGTHIDAPLHFYKDGCDIAALDVNTMVGPAKVVRITNSREISYDDIKDCGLKQGDRVLFRTRNSDIEWETSLFLEDYVYLATDAAQYLAETGVSCVGVDYLSIGGFDNNTEVHRLLLGVPVVIIEGLKLGKVEQGEYDMICLPLKIKDGDGSPARVILRKIKS